MNLIDFFQIATVSITLLVCMLLIWKPFSRKITPLEKGMIHLKNNANEKAITSFTKAIADNPVYFDAYEIRTATFLKTGDFGSALADAETMIKQQPDNHRGYLLRSQIHNERGDFEAMLDDLNIAVELEPSDAKAYELRANTFSKLKKYTKAIEDLTQIIDVIGDTKFQHYLQRGGVFMLTAQFEKSINDLTVAYERAIGQRARYNTLTVRFRAFTQSKQYKKAIKDASEMIYIHPKRTLGYIARAEAYQLEKRYEEALADFQKVVQLDSSETRIYLSIGNAYLTTEKYEDAITAYTPYIEAHPEIPVAYNNRAWARVHLGQFFDALQDARRAVLLDSQTNNYWNTRGQASWHLGDYEQALSDFKQANKLDSEREIHRIEIIVAKFKLDRQAQAIEGWLQVTSEKSKHQSAQAYQDEYRFPEPFYEAMQELEKLTNSN